MPIHSVGNITYPFQYFEILRYLKIAHIASICNVLWRDSICTQKQKCLSVFVGLNLLKSFEFCFCFLLRFGTVYEMLSALFHFLQLFYMISFSEFINLFPLPQIWFDYSFVNHMSRRQAVSTLKKEQSEARRFSYM